MPSCQSFPLAIKMGAGEQGGGGYEGAVSREEEDPISVSFLHHRFVLLWEENPGNSHCYRGYESSVRQDEHKAAAVQGRI